jgi:lipoate-protein ligase A
MKWFFINSAFHNGRYNMDFDLHLSNVCKAGQAYFRLYRWNPYCISLGANQSMDDIDLYKAEADRIDIVKRPTGGRAILHSEEVTYSVVIPIESYNSAQEIYKEINFALLKGLVYYNPKLSSAELEHVQPNFPSIYKDGEGLACFATTAKSELKYGGKKLIGSAQRKLGNIILQHGSLLCGTFHKNIINYLNVFEEERIKIKDELNNKTIELESILNEEIDYSRLNGCLLDGFQNHFNTKFEEQEIDFRKTKVEF